MEVTIRNMGSSNFKRAVALHTLATDSGLPSDAILIFLDVDLIIDAKFLYRVATIVRKGRVYFPTMFSKYAPKTACYFEGESCSSPADPYDFSPHSGGWRLVGRAFDLVCRALSHIIFFHD